MAQGVLDFESVQGDIDPIERRPELIAGKPEFHEITEAVARPVEWKPPVGWYIIFSISVAMLGLFMVSVGWLFWEGIGIWGLQIPVAWAYDITNFVFWVGIGHAGTLISAILFLFRQRWRTSINRSAEAMTLFAVICALIFPAIHTGRPWFAYWMMPIPNQMDMWPQFRSPLMWDVFAVSIYFTVSLIFWYVGLIPDLATMRDRAKSRIRLMSYGIFALGWRGSHRHWLHYERCYLLLAGLATPLVLSVHSVVSFDFAVSQIPGWHTTIFPPYFVAGAIFSGMAMVITLMVISRVAFRLEHIVTMLHFDRMAKLILLTGSMVGYAYGIEFFVAWYSGNEFELYAFVNRAFGPYAWAYWTMVTCNVLVPQVFWFKRARVSIPILFTVSIFVNIGMWFERFVIIVTSLHRDFLPSSWAYFTPTFWDISTLIGSFGLFFTLFCLFVRFLPMVAVAEVKSVLPQAQVLEDEPAEGEEGASRAMAVLPQPAKEERKVYALLAEFETPGQLAKVCRTLREVGYRRWDAHSPFPVHGLEKAMGLKKSLVPWFVLIMGLSGAAAGMILQWWVSAVAYPLIISGKPFFSWPAFVPISFECGVLGGALGAFLGMLILARLPQHHHSLFNSRRFERASDDRFFISIERSDPLFDRERTARLMQELGASHLEWVNQA